MAQADAVSTFIAKMSGPARQAAARYGIPASVLIAQAALETGWGKHVKGNAYFGIKGKSPRGTTITFGTHEEVAGKLVSTKAGFRSYSSVSEAAMDYGKFITSNPRYAKALAHGKNPYAYVDAMAKAGYATDHNYAKLIKGIIGHRHLTKYDAPQH